MRQRWQSPLADGRGLAVGYWSRWCASSSPLVDQYRVVVLGRDEAALLAHDDPDWSSTNVGQWYIDHRTTDSTLFAMCQRRVVRNRRCGSAIPLPWLDGVQHGKDAQTKLVDLFSGTDPPTFVAVYQGTAMCNPSGQVAALLKQRYTTLTAVEGARILGLRDRLPG
jgi:hypothetical protein